MLTTIGDDQVLLADRAYDSDALRQSLGERGARANIKPLWNRNNLPAFSAFLYRYRKLVERFFNGLNTSVPSPPDTKSRMRTTSPSSNSPLREFGCHL